MDRVGTDQDDQLPYWLALYFTPAVGSKVFQIVRQKCRHPREIFQHSGRAAALLGQRLTQHLKTPDWPRVEQHQTWAQSPDHHILTLFDAAYPDLLKQIASPPAILFVHGKLKTLQQKQLAIVGSRNPSPGGKENATVFAQQLHQAGLCITSGLALGIDSASHRGALANSRGFDTIAVTGTGLDQIYPFKNRDLAAIIAENGALVSEFSLGTKASRSHFPRRNRIISGLSLGTLVVEATLNSGSLITARYALEQGREVFAIPGSIREPRATGCHRLIKEGAKLTENCEDIFVEFPSHTLNNPEHKPEKNQFSKHAASRNLEKLPAEAVEVLENIGYEPTSINQVINRSGLTAETVSSMLLVLELQGYVLTSHGSYFKTK